MYAYTLKRLIQFIPTIFYHVDHVFLLNILPGNAALMAVDQRKAPDPELIAQLERDWGLDKPVHVRYLKYLAGLAKGDLGTSFLRKENVSAMLADRIWPTLKLAFAAIGIAVVFGSPRLFSALSRGHGSIRFL